MGMCWVKRAGHLALVALVAAGCTQEPTAPDRTVADTPVPSPTAVPVLTLMTDVVTPASNTLWGVGNPATDVEWRELADAAELTIRAFREVRSGGAGPSDMEWAADPRWQVYSDATIAAARAARLAIERRDLDALLEANGKLVASCEACHVEFHVGANPEES